MQANRPQQSNIISMIIIPFSSGGLICI